jgi:hypothetical protein
MSPGRSGWLNGAMGRSAWRLSAVWMLVFAAAHVYWGFGGTALLPDGVSVLDSLPLFVVDLVAIPVWLAGGLLAWMMRPGQRPSRLLTRRWLLWPGTVGSAVMLVHGLSGTALTVVPWLVSGEPAGHTGVTLLYEPWWLLGGVLLAATVRSFGVAARRAQSLHRKNREASAVAMAAHTASTSHAPTRG